MSQCIDWKSRFLGRIIDGSCTEASLAITTIGSFESVSGHLSGSLMSDMLVDGCLINSATRL